MSYRTQAAEALIDNLHCREVQCQERFEKASEPYDRGLWQGHLDATKVYLEFAAQWLEKIEAEAELVPTPSAEQWLIEEHMAGDLRDFPAVA